MSFLWNTFSKLSSSLSSKASTWEALCCNKNGVHFCTFFLCHKNGSMVRTCSKQGIHVWGHGATRKVSMLRIVDHFLCKRHPFGWHKLSKNCFNVESWDLFSIKVKKGIHFGSQYVSTCLNEPPQSHYFFVSTPLSESTRLQLIQPVPGIHWTGTLVSWTQLHVFWRRG